MVVGLPCHSHTYVSGTPVPEADQYFIFNLVLTQFVSQLQNSIFNILLEVVTHEFFASAIFKF
jgi:hypothetical protein